MPSKTEKSEDCEMSDRIMFPFASIVVAVLVAAVVCVSPALAVPAFPGAEGYGANALGGRGGDVYHVTSLADTYTTGTLRYGIGSATGPRTIVFDVGGTIALTSKLNLNKSNITIAGQTAPGLGICLRNNEFDVEANDLVVRHIHSRMGNTALSVDSISIGARNNVILDHCSASWSMDELLSATDNAATVTVQYSFITEALNYSGHSYGSLLRPDANAWFSFYHNLYADNYSRNPRIGYYNVTTVYLDFRNNVIYNWVDQAGYTEDDGSGCVKTNYVGNYAISGPTTAKNYLFNGKDVPAAELQIYQSGNKIDTDKDGILDGSDTGWAMFNNVQPGSKMTSEFAMDPSYPAFTTMTADDALLAILNYGGASWWNRDSVDANVVSQVLSYGTAGTLYNTVADAGGWPTYPVVTRPAGFDTDNDGMPNDWELAHGLDPNVDDHNGNYDNDDYTNLEEYLNELAAFPAPKPIVWAGGNGRYEMITNWDIPWQPSLYDQVQINSGEAAVDYIGQQAGTVYVGYTAASNGKLAVRTGARLTVADGLVLGNAAGARGTASLTGGSLVAGGPIVLASAGSSTGALKVGKDAYVQVGGLTVNTGSGRSTKVHLEVASDGQSLIHTTDVSTLGGALDVQSLSGFRPREGDEFVVIASTDPNGVHYVGNFTTFTSNITRGLPGSSAFSGAADGSDYELVFLGYTYGDANGDHSVDGGDLALMGGVWMASGQSWATCDFTGNGTVDGGDLALLGGNWMWSLPSPPESSVPEPATLVLIALGAAGLLRRRR